MVGLVPWMKGRVPLVEDGEREWWVARVALVGDGWSERRVDLPFRVILIVSFLFHGHKPSFSVDFL